MGRGRKRGEGTWPILAAKIEGFFLSRARSPAHAELEALAVAVFASSAGLLCWSRCASTPTHTAGRICERVPLHRAVGELEREALRRIIPAREVGDHAE